MRLESGAILLAFALAAAPVFAQQKSATQPARSGFLKDYSKLKPAPDREGVLLYVNTSVKHRDFNKVMFRPVEVYVSPSTQYKGLEPDALKRMTDEFLASFKRALEPAYQVVSEPGPDVLQVRSAITGFQAV